MATEKKDSIRNYEYRMTTGIQRTKEFEKKRLAEFSVNVGPRCGHDCVYCSTPALLRMHPSFDKLGLRPFSNGYSIVDPDIVTRVQHQAERIRKRGLVQLCTYTDAYAPEAKRYDLGRGCLSAILSQPDWRVRVLTKNTNVASDFDVLSKYRDRVLLGISITATPELQHINTVLEPFASTISDRLTVLEEANRVGITTYGMLCPIMPGRLSAPDMLEEMFNRILQTNPVEIFAEPVNRRGSGLVKSAEVLRSSGLEKEAASVDRIRNHSAWKDYAICLTEALLDLAKRKYDPSRMRILLYASSFPKNDHHRLKNLPGVVWLEKEPTSSTADTQTRQLGNEITTPDSRQDLLSSETR